MEELPKDLFNYTTDVGELRGRDLISACSLSKNLNERCNDAFYEKKMQQENLAYQEVYRYYRTRGLTPKQAYIKVFSKALRFLPFESINEEFKDIGVLHFPFGNKLDVRTSFELVVLVKGTFNHFVSLDSRGKLYLEMGDSAKWKLATFQTRDITPLWIEAAFSSNLMEYVIYLQYPERERIIFFDLPQRTLSEKEQEYLTRFSSLQVDRGFVIGHRWTEQSYICNVVSNKYPWAGWTGWEIKDLEDISSSISLKYYQKKLSGYAYHGFQSAVLFTGQLSSYYELYLTDVEFSYRDPLDYQNTDSSIFNLDKDFYQVKMDKIIIEKEFFDDLDLEESEEQFGICYNGRGEVLVYHPRVSGYYNTRTKERRKFDGFKFKKMVYIEGDTYLVESPESRLFLLYDRDSYKTVKISLRKEFTMLGDVAYSQNGEVFFECYLK